MYTLKVENKRGNILNLSASPLYDLLRVDGITPPTASILTGVVGTMDGEQFNAVRLDMRNILLTVRPKAPVEKNRVALYRYFSPKQWVRVYYANGERDVYIDGYVESFPGSLFDNPQSFQISIICPDPYFKDMSEIVHDGSYTTALFEFPFAIEEEGIGFSTYDNTQDILILNDGDDSAGMIITLKATGPVENPILYRRDTLEDFELNFSMQDGDVVEINTRKGNKGVTLTRNGVKYNIVNAVAKNPTWFQLEPGDNIFTYSAQIGEEMLTASFTFIQVYEGV